MKEKIKYLFKICELLAAIGLIGNTLIFKLLFENTVNHRYKNIDFSDKMLLMRLRIL